MRIGKCDSYIKIYIYKWIPGIAWAKFNIKFINQSEDRIFGIQDSFAGNYSCHPDRNRSYKYTQQLKKYICYLARWIGKINFNVYCFN